MQSTLVKTLCTLLLTYTALASAQSEPKPEFVIKEDQAVTGSYIRRNEVSGGQVPMNVPYEQLSPADRQILHSWWEKVNDGDEPPFPLAGLKAIIDPIRKGQRQLGDTGELFIVATVRADGSVSNVALFDSPSDAMTQFAARVLLLTKFKPAKCAGKPCQMDFPFRMNFSVRR